MRNTEKIIYSIGYELIHCNHNSNKTYYILKVIVKKKITTILKIFNKLFKKIITNKEFNTIKNKIIFNKNFDYVNKIDYCLDYNLNNFLYDRNISHKKSINNLNNAKKNLNLIKELKNKKYHIFLFNEKFKRFKHYNNIYILMKKTLLILLLIQLYSEINCFIPNINACFDNKKVLKNSLTLLRHQFIIKNKWEPPEGYVPDKYKKHRWEPPEGYVPDRLKNKEVIEYINNEIEKMTIKKIYIRMKKRILKLKLIKF